MFDKNSTKSSIFDVLDASIYYKKTQDSAKYIFKI